MVFTGTDIKPDFHSHFSLVASENFRIGHAQSGETNRRERKTVFFCPAKFSCSETNQTLYRLDNSMLQNLDKNFEPSELAKWELKRSQKEAGPFWNFLSHVGTIT